MVNKTRKTNKQRGSGVTNNNNAKAKKAPAKAKKDTLDLDDMLEILGTMKAHHGNLPVYFYDNGDIRNIRKRDIDWSDEGGWKKVLIEI